MRDDVHRVYENCAGRGPASEGCELSLVVISSTCGCATRITTACGSGVYLGCSATQEYAGCRHPARRYIARSAVARMPVPLDVCWRGRIAARKLLTSGTPGKIVGSESGGQYRPPGVWGGIHGQSGSSVRCLTHRHPGATGLSRTGRKLAQVIRHLSMMVNKG